MRELSGVMEKFYTLTVRMVTQENTFIRTLPVLHMLKIYAFHSTKILPQLKMESENKKELQLYQIPFGINQTILSVKTGT